MKDIDLKISCDFQTKYSLLDERDIGLVHQYSFEARIEIDKNGNGAKIYAFCYIFERGRADGHFVHNLVWERHCGGIAPGYSVIHKNCVTMDNRLENLTLVPSALAGRWCTHSTHSSQLHKDTQDPHPDTSLYTMAIQQVPYDPADEVCKSGFTTRVINHLLQFGHSNSLRYYDNNGEIVEEEDDSFCYYECRNAPCTQMERGLREFSICGRCQQARFVI